MWALGLQLLERSLEVRIQWKTSILIQCRTTLFGILNWKGYWLKFSMKTFSFWPLRLVDAQALHVWRSTQTCFLQMLLQRYDIISTRNIIITCLMATNGYISQQSKRKKTGMKWFLLLTCAHELMVMPRNALPAVLFVFTACSSATLINVHWHQNCSTILFNFRIGLRKLGRRARK